VREALGRPILHHRTDEFGRIFRETLAGLAEVYRTKNTVLIMTGSGTCAMESAVANLLSPGDRTLVHSTGVFGERFAQILKAYGLSPAVIAEEWGHGADAERLRKALRSEKDLKAVFFQHTDTSTGIVNDLQKLAAVVREEAPSALIVVDAVSGLAAEELETDAWGLDVVLSASQKGLLCPPGLAYAAVSERAWKAAESGRLPRFYLDWRTMRRSLEKSETPFTPAISIVVAQAEALRLIREDGLELVWKRTAELAEFTRKELVRMGLKLFASDPADILTAAWLPAGVDNTLLKKMREEDGVCFAGGQEKLAGRVIRVAHMGAIRREDLEAGLKVLARRLVL
jgi:aspartate aminotransferase-like enzyme